MSVFVNNLTKKYGEQLAIDHISFQLNEGEITGFIGPNGSGKSTTMKSICGLLKPDFGTIEIFGKDVSEDLIEVKRKIGYLPENNPLYYDQYIAEYLRYVGKMYGIRKLNNRVNEIIELTGLLPEKNKKIGQLSKGYKQRVGLAQALIHDPQILILDEPTTGLDPNQLIEIRELVKNIAASKTVLLSTHILQEVEAICHKVIMINNGKIVANEFTEQINNTAQQVQTIRVEFKNDVFEEKIVSLPGITGCKKEKEKVWLIESSSGEDIRETIFNFAMENKNGILEMQTIRRSLEDTFRELSGDSKKSI